MSLRFAFAPFAFALFGLLAACAASTDPTEQEPASNEPAPVQVEVEQPSAEPKLRRAGYCECTLAAGDNVWRCNGQCSDAELRNLPH